MKQRLLRLAILVGVRVREWRVVRRTRLNDAMRWIGHRLQPWVARTAFVDAIQEVNSVRMKIPRPPDGAGTDEFHMALGTYEERELDYVLTRLRPGDTFLDVGAHVGYFTLPAAKAVGPSGRVIAIEPSPVCVRLLRANAELNGFGWITVFEVAASDRNGTDLLACSPQSSMWNWLVRMDVDDGIDTISVSTKTIDSILAECEWPPIVGMKVDVEGAELDVLRGSTSWFDRNPHAFVIVEMAGQMRLESSLAALRLLEEQGYTFRRFKRGAAPTVETISSIAAALEGDHLFNVLAEKPAGGNS